MKICLCALLMLVSSIAFGTPIGGNQLLNLSDIAQQSIRSHVPIVLIFTTPSCKHCKILKHKVIEPMKLEQTTHKPIFVYVDIFDNSTLIDFSGNTISYMEFANLYKVRGTPTIIITSSGGYKLVDPLVGIRYTYRYIDRLENLISKAFRLLGEST